MHRCRTASFSGYFAQQHRMLMLLFTYFCCLISTVSSDLHMWDKWGSLKQTSRNPFFVSPGFFAALELNAATRTHGEVHSLVLLLVSQPWLLCLSQSTSSSLILHVVPIRKWWNTSLRCNTVCKMKGDWEKGSYGFMLSPGGMGA